jgi:hypothetical protein
LAAAEPQRDPDETIRLKLQPAAAPVPALKYQLLPELRDQKPGNAVLLYYRAFSPEWMTWRREQQKQIDAWTDDMRKVPGKELRWVLTSAQLKEIDLGARRAYADWELAERARAEGIGLLLPDMQGFRQLAVLLAMRARLEMADGHLDQAAHTLQTGLALGRHIGEGPTLIQSLVGAAVTNLMLIQVEEMIQTPKAPNLYWALTQLPAPFIDLRKPYQGERLMVDNLFPGMREMLADPRTKPLSEAQVHELVDRLAGALQGLGLTSEHYRWQGRIGLAALAAQIYPQAKRFLLSQGRAAKDVEAMPVIQAALLYEIHNYDRHLDNSIKWAGLPYWQARAGMDQAERELRQAKAAGPGNGTFLATLLVPAAVRVQQASARTDRRIAALRCIEALRLHVAARDGKLPGRLGDIQEVPVPSDPMTGRPFTYTVDGNRAVLYAPPPDGEKAGPHNTLRYELTVAR